MNSVDRLIVEYTSGKVELKALGDVGEFIRGNGLQKSDLADVGVPAIHYGQIHTHYGVWADKTKSFVDPALSARLRRAQPGDLVIATTSEDDAAVARATAWLGRQEAAVSGDAYIYRHTLDPRFVSYFFQSARFQEQKLKYITGTKVRRISGAALARVQIPVPPINVQREIARVLDQFAYLKAKLGTELEAELKARDQQFEYHLSTLFNESFNNFASKKISELGTFRRGGGPQKQDFQEGGVGCIHYGQIYSHYGVSASVTNKFVAQAVAARSKLADPGDVIIAVTGENDRDLARSVAWLGADSVAVSNHTLIFRSGMNPRFVSYFLRSAWFDSAKRRYISGTKVKSLPLRAFDEIEIPVPPLEEQAKIADALDDLSAYVAALRTELSAEVLARRVQYSYYRDRLLTFKGAAS